MLETIPLPFIPLPYLPLEPGCAMKLADRVIGAPACVVANAPGRETGDPVSAVMIIPARWQQGVH